MREQVAGNPPACGGFLLTTNYNISKFAIEERQDSYGTDKY